ncbi:MAG: hypothetical protein C3F13_04075 [Anaerolineales bacterium]|nr:nitroreductase family deazaflavin-dependent oxidoreductase [Anaerolineae bacterium]PWB55555.1 MAG: hypothetical protein C3F13_04075 [Anaerolineales bacterium]
MDDTRYTQNTAGVMAYPKQGSVNRVLFKTPLIWWRMGLGSLLGPAMIVLTTWGRKSHQPRHTMLSYTPIEGCIYIGAGWGERSHWYQNLLADPHVTVQVWSERVTGSKREVVLPALARRVTDEAEFRRIAERLFETGGDSHFKPWLRSYGIAYDLEDMLAKRDRLHQVALDYQPIVPGSKYPDNSYPTAMETDLRWVWAALAGSFAVGWLLGSRRK